MKDIILINPPSPFLIDDKVHPPLGLLYVAAHIRSHHLGNPVVADLAGPRWESRLKKLWNADFYGVTATTPQYGYALRILKYLQSHHKKALKFIGGAHPSSKPAKCLEDGWDTVIVGEGEQAMNFLLNDAALYRKHHRQLYAPPNMDINALSFPARDLIDINSYKYKIGRRAATTMISSRGCPYSCAFCSKKVMCGPIRKRSVENVNAEIAEVQDRYKFNAIMFYDDIFAVDYPRIRDITEFMKERDIIYRCFVRANLASEKILDQLAETGCYEIGFGAESGSNDILKIIGKCTTVEMNTRLVRFAHDRGIRVKAFLIAGLPGETRETLAQTEHWIRTAQPDEFDITILTPYPGSDIYDFPERYDISFKKDDEHYDRWFYKGKAGEYTPVVATRSLSAREIVEARDEIERKWKSRRRQS